MAHPHEALLRELAPRALAILLRRYRDFTVCEDAVQEALLAAAQQWGVGRAEAGEPIVAVPTNPLAWLTRVASRRVTDHVRAEAARRVREALVVSLIPLDEQVALAADVAEAERDDTLELVFMCCHPSLTRASAIALTLRAVGGLTTAEIARAFFVPEATMAQRLSRAKETIRVSGVPFTATLQDAQANLPTVLQVLYLMFNEGYAASATGLVRVDLSEEAIRLGRMLSRLMPDEPEVMGLLSLMLLTHARRDARTGPSGELVPLDEQDRTRWEVALIDEGEALVDRAFMLGRVGPYQLQAAIAALHDRAASTEATDWRQILALYGVLLRVADSPLARLSHAVARAMVDGPEAGLAEVAAISPKGIEQRVLAVSAHLLSRAGRRDEALAKFRQAAALASNTAERNYLLLKSCG